MYPIRRYWLTLVCPYYWFESKRSCIFGWSHLNILFLQHIYNLLPLEVLQIQFLQFYIQPSCREHIARHIRENFFEQTVAPLLCQENERTILTATSILTKLFHSVGCQDLLHEMLNFIFFFSANVRHTWCFCTIVHDIQYWIVGYSRILSQINNSMSCSGIVIAWDSNDKYSKFCIEHP